MNIPAIIALALSVLINMSLGGNPAYSQEISAIRTGDGAFAFASGAIQKTTPRDGIVNLITGDNQSSSNRMFLGIRDTFYLKLNNPRDVAVGDLFTVYKQVRKVFHPLTNQYLGFVMLRLAVVKVTDTGHALTTVQALTSYGQISPGDPVMRYVAPSATDAQAKLVETEHLTGMIVEIQADKPMTMVSHHNAVYLDRGNADGLRIGDLLDIQRRSAGLPTKNIGQLKVVATEEHTATAQVVKATARVFKGDRFKLVGYSEPIAQPVEIMPVSATGEQTPAVPGDLVADALKTAGRGDQSRINLGDLEDFLRYDSGDASIKPIGYKVLDQLIEHLSTSRDTRLIRVEGHTDNVEIGPSLKARYPSNVELSKARAANVARYLIEKGSIESARLHSVGLGDSKPIATNANEEGRSKNRRVEIVLYNPTTDSHTSTSDADHQTQPAEHQPSEVNPQGTMSTLPGQNDSSHAFDPEHSSPVSTDASPKLDMGESGSETSRHSDTGTVMPSDGQPNATDPSADTLGTEPGSPTNTAMPSDDQPNATDPSADMLGTEPGSPTNTAMPSDGQPNATDPSADMLGTELGSPSSNAPANETDNQSEAPVSASMDPVGF